MRTADQIRQIIRRQTNLLGQPVTNLLGTVLPLSESLAVNHVSQWRVARIIGDRLPTLDEFYAIYASTQDVSTYVVDALEGVAVAGFAHRVVGDILFEGNPLDTFLVMGTIENTTTQAIPISIESEEASAEFAVYVDGTLARRGVGRLQITVSLPAGRHVIQVIGTATVFGVAVPESVLVTASSELLQPVVWSSITTGYLDPSTGSTAVVLSWYNALNVGGWRILRSTRTDLGQIVTIGPPNSSQEFGIEITGDWVAEIQVGGTQLYAGTEPMGTVLQVDYDSATDLTLVLVRLTNRVQTNTFWLNRIAAIGQMTEVANIRRTATTSVISWTDMSVTIGVPYVYVIQAFGLFDASLHGAFSEHRYIRAGDITPPASITFQATYPVVLNHRATVKFVTPVDEDYDGVRVYYKDIAIANTATGGSANTLVDTTPGGMTVDAYVGFYIKIVSGTGAGQIRIVASNTATVFTTTGDWTTPPNGTSVYEVYEFVRIITDYGIPNAQDELLFEPIGDGDYYFVSFDKAGNEQQIDDALIWGYDAATDDTFIAADLGPVVGIEQLTATAQQALGAPYNDTLNYAVIRVSASDPVDGTTGVTIQYKRRQDAAFVTGLAASASGSIIDNPNGTRGRLIPISRAENVNWIQVKALDVGSMESDLFTFVPDYDNNPEISSIDSRQDTVLNRVVTSLVVDDDTFSIEWWLDQPDLGEPSYSARNKTFFDLRATKVCSFTFALTDGQSKTLHVVPYANINQTGIEGEHYTEEFSRPPRTTIAFEDIDINNVHRADQVRVTFRVAPSPFGVEATGTASGGDSNHLFDTSQTYRGSLVGQGQIGSEHVGQYWAPSSAFSPSVYGEVGNRVFFVRIDSGTGAGQCRRIISNTDTTLEVSPSWLIVPSSDSVYTIQRGGTQYRVNGTGEFTGIYPELPESSPTPYDHLFFVREDTDLVLEYYTRITGVPPEPVHRVIIDADTTPEIGTLVVSEYAANQLRISIADIDDDAKRWKAYARKGTGAWPTVPGTETGDPLDETYLRFDGPISKLSFEMTVGNGNWNVIVVPINSYGDPGPRLTETKNVVGTGDTDPQLSDFTTLAHDDGSTAYYNKLSWNHNSVISDSSTTHSVKLFAYRDDLGSGTQVEFTSPTPRRPWMDVGSNFVNSDDVNESGQNGKGSVLHQVEQRVTVGTPGSVQRRWRYKIELYESAVLKATYQLEHYDYYIPAPPSFSGGATLTEINTGDCNYTTSWVATEHENRVTWLLLNTQNVNEFQVDIDYAPEPSGFNFTPLVTGLSITDTQRYFEDNFINGPPNDFTKNWTYRVRLVRKTDSSLIDSKTTSTLSQNGYVTCPVPLPAPDFVNLLPGENEGGSNTRVEMQLRPQATSVDYPGLVMDLERWHHEGVDGGYVPHKIFTVDSVGSDVFYFDNEYPGGAMTGNTYSYRIRLRSLGLANGPYDYGPVQPVLAGGAGP